jgi:hypothetical protein
MTYRCLDCGHIFEEGEEARWRESRGECWGTPCSEEVSGCPLCRGDYEETTPCAICGSAHLEDELNGGVCDECIEKYRKDFEICYNVSLGETVAIKINSLLASLFDVGDIEQILKEYIYKKWWDVDCIQFIDEDKSWFGERLAEEVKKNENAKG